MTYSLRARLRHVLCALVATAAVGASPFGAAAAAAADAGTPSIDVAHSALLVADATETGDRLALSIRRAKDHSVVDSKDVTVAIDGKGQTVTRLSDGSYSVPLDDLRGKDAKAVQIVIAHDGIREILDGKVPGVSESSAANLLGGHKQLAWWIINMVVVLVGVTALARRKSF